MAKYSFAKENDEGVNALRLWWRKSRTSDEKLARRETPAKTRKKKTREERGKTTQENSV